MQALGRLLVVIAALLATNATSFFVLSSNQQAGVYPVNADSIGMPIMEMLTVSALMFLLLAGALFVRKKRLAGTALGVLLCVSAAALSTSVVLSWAIPQHYSIAIAGSLPVAISIWLAWVFVRERQARRSKVQTTGAQA
jgi:hypothetical protein